MTDREIITRIVKTITDADTKYNYRHDEDKSSDEATDRDLATFDEIVDILTEQNRLGSLLALR